MGSTAFYSPSIIDIVEKEMSIPTDVPTLQHVTDRSPASTSSQNHRKQRTESMPVSEAPPRAGEYASASSNASSTPTDDIPIPSSFAYDVGTTFAVHGRKHVASNSTKFAVLHEAFDDPDSPPFDDLNMRKPTVMMITKQTFVLMCVFCLLLPASSSDSYHSGRAIQRWTAGDTTPSTTTKLLPTPTTNANYQLRPTLHARDDAQPFVQRAVEHSIADADVTSATTSVLSTSNVTTRFDLSTATGVIGAGEINHIDRIPTSVYHSYIGDSSHGGAVPSGTANWSTSTTVPIGDPTNDGTDLRHQRQQPAPNERHCDQWGMKEGINLCALLTTFNLVCVWWFRLCTTTIYPDSEDKSNARNLDQDSQQERMGAKKRRTMTKQNGCKPTQGPQ